MDEQVVPDSMPCPACGTECECYDLDGDGTLLVGFDCSKCGEHYSYDAFLDEVF